MRLIEAGGQSGGRGHGRDRRGQQSLADHVRPQPVETDQMVLPDQLHDRGGQRELTARKAPVTFLDRADPRVQRGSDAKTRSNSATSTSPPFSVSDPSGTPVRAFSRVQRLPGVREAVRRRDIFFTRQVYFHVRDD
ncbi:hypothetical protein [Streptomyces chiangmaiensis]|uniref:hypothetical protein n=1 Tax=Streptomyces chiangmaiensis TaxID=766497 RepID=UPI0031E9784D